MKKSANPKAPKTLTVEARRWWNRLTTEYQIEDEAGLFMLQIAMEAFGTMRAAQVLLDRDGLVTQDRFAQPRAHPAATIARDARAAMLAAFKALNLDVEPLRDRPGRPGGS
ncbi:MAG: P27 family phage terminase small subunit [Acidobacteriota bacterium]